MHRQQFREQVGYCQQAVELAKVTNDRPLVAATLTRLGVAWFYFGKPEKYCLGMANAIPLSLDDDLFIPALDFDLSEKISWEGSIDINIGELEEKKGFTTKAESWYKKATAVLAQKLPPGFPERTLLQTINHQGRVAIKLGQKDKYIASFQEGVQGARAIGSKKRLSEIIKNQEDAKQRWPHEQDVWKLDNLLFEDEEGNG